MGPGLPTCVCVCGGVVRDWELPAEAGPDPRSPPSSLPKACFPGAAATPASATRPSASVLGSRGQLSWAPAGKLFPHTAPAWEGPGRSAAPAQRHSQKQQRPLPLDPVTVLGGRERESSLPTLGWPRALPPRERCWKAGERSIPAPTRDPRQACQAAPLGQHGQSGSELCQALRPS